MSDPMTFADGVLAGHDSVKGLKVIAADGPAGKVLWASYSPGESYLVVTVGRVSRKHHVVPAGFVTGVDDREVRVTLSGDAIRRLPDVEKPYAPLDGLTGDQLQAVVMGEWAKMAGGAGR